MQSPPSASRPSQKIVYLDYLRIFACIGVFACHLWIGAILPHVKTLSSIAPECLGVRGDSLYRCGFEALFVLPNQSWEHLLFNGFNLLFGLGYQAVPLFFILSGFGLTLSALMIEKKTTKIHWFSFLKKRVLRLYPSYWLILTIYLGFTASQYPSLLGLLKTYIKGAIFLDVLPATWYIPILLQLYLLFPLLFYCLKKLSLKNFLGLSLLVKVFSSAVIITVSSLTLDKIVGFGYGGLAPGGVALTRSFEFCFGMAIAQHWVNQGCSLQTFNVFTKLPIVLSGVLLEVVGLILSLKYGAVNFRNHAIPVGLFISDALIGVGIFILSLNLMFWVDAWVKNRRLEWLNLISNGTYEAYLIHGCILGIFIAFLVEPWLKASGSNSSYWTASWIYVASLVIFVFITLSAGCILFNLKSYLVKKWALLSSP
jgi:peptidoglycan/LPS O-acetylase OafA/YrhL